MPTHSAMSGRRGEERHDAVLMSRTGGNDCDSLILNATDLLKDERGRGPGTLGTC